MPSSTTNKWLALALLAAAQFVVVLDASLVNVALPSIGADLNFSQDDLSWVINAYVLVFGGFLLLGGRLADLLGRRRLFIIGLILFAVASLAGGLAQSEGWLIGARAVQGAGAALLMPLGLALLSEAFPPERRGAAIGIFSAITGLAVAAGPLVGGAVVQGLSWHWIFWLNVPIGAVAAPLAMRKMRESYGPRTSIDVTGLLLVSGGAFGVVWGLVRGNQSGWGSPEVITALVAGVVLLGAFVRWQVQTPTPMLPPQLFRSRAFTAGNAAIFLTFASLFTGVFFFAQLLQVVLGHDALGAGLRLLPWTATFITVAPVAGALADRIGERLLLSVGLALEAAGFLWLVAVADPGLTYGQLIGPFVLAGVGVSMAIPCAQNAVVGGVDSDSIGAAAGVNSMMRELGGVFGIAVTVAVFAGSGDYGSVLGFLDGFRPAIVTAAGFAVVGAVCGLAVPARQRHGMVQPDLALAS